MTSAMEQAFLFGLVSALCYGGSDLAARFATRRAGTTRTLLWGAGGSALVLGIALLAHGPPHAPAILWALAIVSNALALIGTACLYRALATGRLAVVCPITATYGAVTAILAAASGEKMGRLAWAGLVLTMLGGVLAARPGASDGGRPGRGAGLAAAASILYGVAFWIYGTKILPAIGVLGSSTLYYGVGFLCLALYHAGTKPGPRGAHWALPPGAALPVAATSTLAMAGTLALALGQHSGHVAVATCLSALAAGVTVLLGRVFLREPVGPGAALGTMLVLAGLVLLRAG